MNRRLNISQPDDSPDSVTFLPYIGTIFNRISRVLSWHKRSVGLPPQKVSSFFQLVRDNLVLTTLGVYRIPCEVREGLHWAERPLHGHKVEHVVLNIQTSQPWLNTALSFTIPPSSPLRPNKWITLLGRPLRSSSIPTV
jgi:hypothetical protein